MSASDFYLKLDRPVVTVEEFAAALDAMCSLIKAVGDEVTEGRFRGVRWVIQHLQAGSALISAAPELVDDSLSLMLVDKTMQAVGEGLGMLESSAERPPYFSDVALRAAKTLAEALSTSDVGAAAARFGNVAVQPTKRVSGNVDDLIVGRVKSIGSVDGRLVTLNASDHLELYIEDRVRGRRVKCVIGDELLPQVLQSFTRRVIVRGVIWSRKDGSPQRIEVRHFEAVDDDDKLPRSRDVRGLLRDIQVNAQ